MKIKDKYRNTCMPLLQQYSSECGDALKRSCGITNARYILGGSLGYKAALKGDYDIDLRLLVPDKGKNKAVVRRQIDAVKDYIAKQAKGDKSFKVKFIDENGKNYIWHTKQIVKVPGIPGDPDVKLTWNIQAESTYKGIAEMAAKLPREVIDKYVVAKWEAKQKSDQTYRALKKRWMKFIEWLIDNDTGKGIKVLLEEAEKANKIPSFLK